MPLKFFAMVVIFQGTFMTILVHCILVFHVHILVKVVTTIAPSVVLILSRALHHGAAASKKGSMATLSSLIVVRRIRVCKVEYTVWTLMRSIWIGFQKSASSKSFWCTWLLWTTAPLRNWRASTSFFGRILNDIQWLHISCKLHCRFLFKLWVLLSNSRSSSSWRHIWVWFCPVWRVGVRMSVCHQCRGKDVCLLPYCTLIYFRTAWRTLGLPADFIWWTGLKFTGACSSEFHSTNWTEIHRNAFMQISFNKLD